MKKTIIRVAPISLLLALTLSVTAWSGSLTNQQGEAKKPQDVNSGGHKSLRQEAQEHDVEILASEVNTQASTLRYLKKTAMAIIIGHVSEEKSYFDGDSSIVTSYMVDIQRVLKYDTSNWGLPAKYTPPAPLISPLKIIRDGGEVYVNGHRASEKIDGSELLKPNKDYVIFLTWSPFFKAYRPVGGVSGFFMIENSHLKPIGSEKDIKKHEGATLQALVDEILRTDN